MIINNASSQAVDLSYSQFRAVSPTESFFLKKQMEEDRMSDINEVWAEHPSSFMLWVFDMFFERI